MLSGLLKHLGMIPLSSNIYLPLPKTVMCVTHQFYLSAWKCAFYVLRNLRCSWISKWLKASCLVPKSFYKSPLSIYMAGVAMWILVLTLLAHSRESETFVDFRAKISFFIGPRKQVFKSSVCYLVLEKYFQKNCEAFLSVHEWAHDLYQKCHKRGPNVTPRCHKRDQTKYCIKRNRR